jgi:hypothetical protein
LVNGAGALMRVNLRCILVMCMAMHMCNTATFTRMQDMCMRAPHEREGDDYNHQNLADHSAHPGNKAGIAARVKSAKILAPQGVLLTPPPA